MRRSTFLGAGVSALAALTFGPIERQAMSGDDPSPEPKAVTIPLASILSTHRMRGLLRKDAKIAKVGEHHWEEIRKGVSGGGPNILLVAADDTLQLISATRNAYATSSSAETAVTPDMGQKPTPSSIWMVAFLGVGSRTRAWVVQSAERRGRVIRLSGFEPKRTMITMDQHHYFVWVPLGKLDPGKYTLELFDTETKEVTLMRRVTVVAK